MSSRRVTLSIYVAVIGLIIFLCTRNSIEVSATTTGSCYPVSKQGNIFRCVAHLPDGVPRTFDSVENWPSGSVVMFRGIEIPVIGYAYYYEP